MMLSAALLAVALAPPTVVPKAGLTIRTPVRFKAGAYALNGPITISGDNLDLDFRGVTLRGTPASAEPDTRKGTGIIITGKNVTVRNLAVHGYKIGLEATGATGLKVLDSDLSYNYKPRLKSGRDREDTGDWMSFHNNEKDQWKVFGAGLYLKKTDGFKLRNVTVRGGSNGLLLTESNGGEVYNSDFSFLSALGIGMYRSSENRIMHNNIDWCVRGYSHGIYNRGQDSAGILIYEQSSKNVIAYNSVTHGGDGFFLWAGQTTMDTGQGGCNDNLVYGNDFSHAPTNGIETTFSRNTYAHNLMLECWHGVWGGYSYDTVFAGNVFGRNAEAIAIEHGQNISIVGNTFVKDLGAIRLWQNASQDPNWGYPKHRDTENRDYKVHGNLFRDLAGYALRLDGVRNFSFEGNTVERVATVLHPGPKLSGMKQGDNRFKVTDEALAMYRAWMGSPGPNAEKDPKYTPSAPTMQPSGNTLVATETDTKAYLARFGVGWKMLGDPLPAAKPYAVKPVAGGKDPSLKPGQLRGRRFILVDQWGPYDFRSPIVWERRRERNRVFFDVLGPKGAFRVKSERGGKVIALASPVPGQQAFEIAPGAQDIGFELEYVGAETTDYRGMVTPAGRPLRFGWSEFRVPQSWTVDFWNFNKDSQDPRTQEAEFAARLQQAPDFSETVPELAYAWYRAPNAKVNADHFATEAAGTFRVPAGTYVLDFTADDGIRAELDGKLIVDEWKYSGPQTYSRTVKLPGGEHRVRVRHFELDGFATLKFAVRRAP